ncbi:MAG: division/cell wall cluster transcriptional repressor MraZ, partial [Clostridia bacterium]|nr:division/cell wall cluster transcriptional repressor MraZ [Clostridia bacterium]
FFSSVSEHSVDNQGRITLDARHVNHAELSKEVAVVGAGSRVVLMPLEKFKVTETNMENAVDYSVNVGW